MLSIRVGIAVVAAAMLAGCYVAVGFDGAFIGTTLDITQQPQSQTVRVGQRASFSVSVTGTGPIWYQWHRNGVDIAGAHDFTYVTPPATVADSGSLYTVRVCNDVVCTTSSPAVLTVLPD